MVARAGEAASFPFLVHSHMLRHSCGCKLANDGQDTRAIQHYLGHKSINSTMSDLRLEAWRERCGISVPEGEMLQAWRMVERTTRQVPTGVADCCSSTRSFLYVAAKECQWP